MAVADLNNDGTEDFLVTTFRNAYLYTYLVNPDGSITQAGKYPLGSNTLDIAVGQLNGDHFIDAVTSDPDTNEMFIYFGNGDGTMTLANVFIPGNTGWSIEVGDLNADGFDDIILGLALDYGFIIYYGNGQGLFLQTDFISTPGHGLQPAIEDFNGDGYNDLALGVGNASEGLRVYFGGPNGFSLSQTFARPTGGILAMDINMDGHYDLAAYGVVDTPEGNGKSITVLINQGDGTFVITDVIYSGLPGKMSKGDLNNDGFQDLIMSTRGPANIRVYLADGLGSFNGALTYTMPDETDGTIILDLNLDATPDILASVYYSSSHREVVPVHNHNFYQFPVCGNSRINRGETCDDGNTAGGDGCSPTCRLEVTGDSDHDGLTDAEETILFLTDPLDPDTDYDCVFDGDEVCAGANPLDPADQEGCMQIVSPAGTWHMLATLLEAPPAPVRCDVYLTSPRSEPLIKNSTKNVGKVAQGPVRDGELITFNVHADATALGYGEGDFASDSSWARVTRIDAYTYKVGFEIATLELADWSYDDLVLMVELLPDTPAVGIHRNLLDEYQATEEGSTVMDTDVALAFDGFASVSVPPGALSGEAGVIVTAGLPELYGGTVSGLDGQFIGEYRKVTLTNGQEQLVGDPAEIVIAYNDDDDDGIVDGTGVSELDLVVKRYDQDSGSWVVLDSEVDPINNLVIAPTDHFSLFGVSEHKPLKLNCGVWPGGAADLLPMLIAVLPALGMRLAARRGRRCKRR
jgi:cysteine-rich repeat protein